MPAPTVTFIGQVARDLVLVVESAPGPGESAQVLERHELLGGKGANQAVACARLGAEPALVGVVGDDATGEALLAQAAADGIETSGVVRRRGTASGLVVDVVDGGGRWHYLEDLPSPVLLAEEDVTRSAHLLAGVATVVLQLQQPVGAVLTAARLARRHRRRLVVDGRPPEGSAEELLGLADVLRADAHEAGLILGRTLAGVQAVAAAAEELLGRGPALVMLGAGAEGEVLASQTGTTLFGHPQGPVADTTGAGDAAVAALAVALTRGDTAEDAGRLAAAAGSLVVRHPGGRPRLEASQLRSALAQTTVHRLR